MISSMSALLVFFIVVLSSILIANFASKIFTDDEVLEKLKAEAKSLGHKGLYLKQNDLTLDNAENHLMWFMQISDLHISIFEDQTRISDFRDFAKHSVDIIKPKVVLASGDLTDGKDKNKLGSRTYEKEWKIYWNILTTANITEKTLWLDIRGNHDYFNVPHSNSDKNYFAKYSIQGRKFRRSYMQQITDGTEKYTFIAVDASLEPGPKRQLHFVGMLSSDDLKDLINMNKEAIASNSNYTILFGHYPTSCILSPGGERGLREIIGSFEENYAYLCGHFHTQGGFIPRMYTLHKNGFLELELGDWKKHRLFRVAAFDHGLFSFTDVHYNDWPIILVTNPKNALFNIPHKENINIQKNSKHIRMLIFAPTKVESCRIKFDEKEQAWINCMQVNNVLYVVPWDPLKFKNGLHHLYVHVRTIDGNVKFVKHPFSLDGTRLNFDLLASIILNFDLTQIFQIIYGIALSGCVIPLCLFRIGHELFRCGKIQKTRIKNSILRGLVTNFALLSSIDRLFMPLILYCVYISIAPWAFTEIVDGHMGIVFLWGYFVNNTFVPGTLTYIYGAFQLTFCQFPLLFIYAYEIRKRFNSLKDCEKSAGTVHFRKFYVYIFKMCWDNMPFLLIILVEIVLAFVVLWIHGFLAFILAPFRTWSVFYHIALYYFAKNIPTKLYMSVSSTWL